MKKYSKILMIMLTLALLVPLCTISVSANGGAIIDSPDKVTTGENFTVSITFSAEENIGTIQSSLSYDDSLLQFISSDNASGGGGILNINGFPASQSNELVVTLTFMGIKDGTAEISLVNSAILSPEGTMLGTPSAQTSIKLTGGEVSLTSVQTTTQPQTTTTKKETTTTEATTMKGMPSEGVLKSLTVDNGTLEPAFAYNVYEYTVKVDNSVTNVEIEGQTAALTDYIWYTGNSECMVGNNIRTITVTDQNGNETTYTITIIRAAPGETFSTTETGVVTTTRHTETKSVSSVRDDDGMEKYRELLNPALAIVLVVLIIALVVVIYWMKTRVKRNITVTKSSRKK